MREGVEVAVCLTGVLSGVALGSQVSAEAGSGWKLSEWALPIRRMGEGRVGMPLAWVADVGRVAVREAGCWTEEVCEGGTSGGSMDRLNRRELSENAQHLL